MGVKASDNGRTRRCKELLARKRKVGAGAGAGADTGASVGGGGFGCGGGCAEEREMKP